jgi:hypothetical protein
LAKEFGFEMALAVWLTMILGPSFIACYTRQGPKTACNPADYGCDRTFGSGVDGGGGG